MTNLLPKGVEMSRGSSAASAGIGFGAALAMVISWSVNHSIIWAIIDGILSWFYVIYYALTSAA